MANWQRLGRTYLVHHLPIGWVVISQVVHWNDPNARSCATTSCCNIVSLKSANLQGSSCSSRMIGWNEIYIKVRWSVLNPSYCTKKNMETMETQKSMKTIIIGASELGILLLGWWCRDIQSGCGKIIWVHVSHLIGLFGGYLGAYPMVCQDLPKVAMESHKFLVMASSSIVYSSGRCSITGQYTTFLTTSYITSIN